ncbi:roadblock/LC7 domain-containing protein [Micromonospora sp. BRA006-A]|nr:roadblock/LC7 domain-containing protein [Micromonospora sp. BRA006-A]
MHGCVLGGVDGLLVTHNLQNGADPDDLAALSATMYGLGRQVGRGSDRATSSSPRCATRAATSACTPSTGRRCSP